MPVPPLPYHTAVRDHLKAFEPGLWQWFMSDDFSGEHAESSKLELLKSCYRMGREAHADLYRIADVAAARLEIRCPITIYQAQTATAEPNASLYFFNDELCVVLSGSIAELLEPDELKALFGHEFSHHRLYTESNGEYFAAARLLVWCVGQPDCHDAYVETARRYQLHTELYADQGAALVCDGPEDAISTLVKVNTGLKNVTVADYLAQADEVLAKDDSGSEAASHPETYIRAKALSLASANASVDTDFLKADTDFSKVDTDFATLVRGKLDAQCLDLLDQRELARLTFDIAQTIGEDPRFRDDAHRMLLREYFPSFQWEAEALSLASLRDEISSVSETTHIYLAFVLLDIATADRDDALPLLGATLQFADGFGLLKVFEATARKELRLKKADTDRALRDSLAKPDE